MTAGRRCRRCGGRMRSHLRHVHELECGDAFRFPHREEPDRLVGLGKSGATVRGVAREERVSFTDGTGEPVAFTAKRSAERRVAACAEVIPLEEA